jgi:hypothetical protein
MTDLEGHCAWAYGHGDDIFYQCGGVNERSVGIEQVSYIPMMLEKGIYTMAQAKLHWAQRTAQLHATARIIAAWHQVAPSKHRINYSSGLTAGVTTHWDVSQHFAESEGHTDCHPAHKGGYYPALEVIDLARGYVSLGYHF